MADQGELSAALRKRILRDFRASVFFVMITPRRGQIKNFKSRMNTVGVLPDKERTAETKRNRVGTGFVVEDGQNSIKILTAAHIIDHVFTARMPMSAEEVNLMFQIHVLCDHAELHYIAGRTSARAYSEASVLDINCEKDMLLIQIAKNEINRSVNAKGQGAVCPSAHPQINRTLHPPEPFNEDVMISWPAEKHCTSVTGFVSHCSRTIKVMPGDNANGYSMRLMEVGIRSEVGSSGAALLNGEGQYVGMLHGGTVQFSYFVAWDMSTFLGRNGIAMIA